jgi:hypothetical protein
MSEQGRGPDEDRIVERISRGILRALKSQFASPHEAFCELVDNAVNYRGEGGVDVWIEISDEQVVVENVGGRGMGLAEIRDFVTWGGGEQHGSEEISCYNQGGKSAIAYLGDGYTLWAKRAGAAEWRRLDDEGIGTRLEPKDYGALPPLAPSEAPAHLRHVPLAEGAVRIELRDLDASRRISAEALGRSLGDAYGRLILSGELRLWVDGESARPWEPLLDEEVERALIHVEEDGVLVEGWCGKLCRRGGPRQPRPGFRLFAKGRLIREGEWWGANSYAKGSLASFYGELTVDGLTPNLNKADFIERGTHLWQRLAEEVLRQAQPVLDQLRGPGDPARVTDRDRRLARQVRRELEEALEALLGKKMVSVEHEREVRRELGDGPGVVKVKGRGRGGRIGGPGRLVRRTTIETVVEEIEVPALPEIRVDSWESTARAETRFEGGQPIIYVNKNHPGWAAANARFFLAESAIQEALRSGPGAGWDVDGFCDRADEALAEWARGQEASADDEA